MKPKLAIDLDGTMSKTNDYFLKLFNFKHDTKYEISDLTKWASWEELDVDENAFYEVYDYMTSTGLLAETPIMDEKLPYYVQQLQKKYDVDCVTARDKLGTALGRQWLQKKKIPIDTIKRVPRDRVGNKFELNYDIIIDDCPHYYQVAKEQSDKYVIIHAATWNEPPEYYQELDNIIRLDSWELIYNHLMVEHSFFTNTLI